MRSRVTKKGQVTVPSELRRKFHIEPGKSIEFKGLADQEGIMIKPIRDIMDSAGELSKFGSSRKMIKELTDSRRKEPFM
jgi:AbrB family looped-hinge helix DNA binding protein